MGAGVGRWDARAGVGPFGRRAMLVKTLIPKMFHRRLLVLLLLVSAGAAPLAAQLANLSIVRGDELRRQAESRLVRSVQTPTVRGRVLDRKGRVLAQDRPSYDLAVTYPAITGDWARAAAREAARRSAGSGWAGLGPEGRARLTERFLPPFQAHADQAWNRLAEAAGVSRPELEVRRDEVIRRVEARQKHITEQRLKAELAVWAERGETPDARESRAIQRRAEEPIAERTQAHVLVSRVTDQVGFECRRLAEETSSVPLPGEDDRLRQANAEAFADVDLIPGLVVRDSGDREYPFESLVVSLDRSQFPSPLRSDEPLAVEVEGVAVHVLGTMRDRVYGSVEEEREGRLVRTVGDAERRDAYLLANPADRQRAYEGLGVDLGSYRDGDRVGATGVERSEELTLRGLRGYLTTHLDTGAREALPARPGGDVHLALDIMLQARVQAIMTPQAGLASVQPWHKQESATKPVGSPLNGAAVVLDVETGDVLAMVSMPSPGRSRLRTEMADLLKDEVNTPLVNRATGKYYTPGSIVKPLLLCEAVKRGNFSLSQTIDCTGHLFENRPTQFRCWIYKRFQQTHTAFLNHEPTAEEAIMVSCNIFFFTLGQRMGPGGVIDSYEAFHVGKTFDLGVGGEVGGRLGFRSDAQDYGMQLWDAIQMGIGQGPVTWTPMHAASAYATIVRGGVYVPPRVITSRRRPEPEDLGIPSGAIDAAMAGLSGSVNDRSGTGHHIMVADAQGNEHQEPVFEIPGVRVWGKTGTATAPRIVINDPDGPNGPLKGQIAEEGDHSWFVVLVGRDRPRFVVSVVVDYGGSGGKVSGPICAQIVRALIEEGYL